MIHKYPYPQFSPIKWLDNLYIPVKSPSTASSLHEKKNEVAALPQGACDKAAKSSAAKSLSRNEALPGGSMGCLMIHRFCLTY